MARDIETQALMTLYTQALDIFLNDVDDEVLVDMAVVKDKTTEETKISIYFPEYSDKRMVIKPDTNATSDSLAEQIKEKFKRVSGKDEVNPHLDFLTQQNEETALEKKLALLRCFQNITAELKKAFKIVTGE